MQGRAYSFAALFFLLLFLQGGAYSFVVVFLQGGAYSFVVFRREERTDLLSFSAGKSVLICCFFAEKSVLICCLFLQGRAYSFVVLFGKEERTRLLLLFFGREERGRRTCSGPRGQRIADDDDELMLNVLRCHETY